MKAFLSLKREVRKRQVMHVRCAVPPTARNGAPQTEKLFYAQHVQL